MTELSPAAAARVRRRASKGWIPRRMCAGCRIVRPRPDLVRLGLGAGGEVRLDILGRLPGRGAYLCRTTAARCLEAARRRRALVRSLRVSDHRVDYAGLCAELEALNPQGAPWPR